MIFLLRIYKKLNLNSKEIVIILFLPIEKRGNNKFKPIALDIE
jgi:hypothetical protein